VGRTDRGLGQHPPPVPQSQQFTEGQSTGLAMAERLIGVLGSGPLPSAAAFWLVSVLGECTQEACAPGEPHTRRQTQVWDCGCAGGQAHPQLESVSRVGEKPGQCPPCAPQTKKLAVEGAVSGGEGACPGSPGARR